MVSFRHRFCVAAAFVKGLAILLALHFFGATAQAAVLDWSTASWTPGALTGSFDIDPSNPGNDVTVEFTGDVIYFAPASPYIGTNSIGGGPNTGGTGQAGLQMGLDFGAGTTSINVVITFHYDQGVNGTFDLRDVDREDSTRDNNKTVDTVSNLVGTVAGGGITAASSVSAGSAIDRTGFGLAATYTGNAATVDSPDSVLGINFAGSPVTKISLTFSPGSNSNSGPQWIALSNIDFTPVPETGASLGALALCLGILLIARRRRRADAR